MQPALGKLSAALVVVVALAGCAAPAPPAPSPGGTTGATVSPAPAPAPSPAPAANPTSPPEDGASGSGWNVGAKGVGVEEEPSEQGHSDGFDATLRVDVTSSKAVAEGEFGGNLSSGTSFTLTISVPSSNYLVHVALYAQGAQPSTSSCEVATPGSHDDPTAAGTVHVQSQGGTCTFQAKLTAPLTNAGGQSLSWQADPQGEPPAAGSVNFQAAQG
jgi:hypothetical protein